MNVRWQRRLSRAALLLLIIAAGPAVAWLGLKMMLAGSLLLVQAALEHPYWTMLLLAVLQLLAALGVRGGVARHARAWQVLSRVPLWLVSIVTGVLLFQILACVGLVLSQGSEVFNTRSLREALRQNPLLHGANLTLLGLLWFAVIRGDYRRMITLAARAFIVPGCGLALILSAELFWIGIIGLGVEGASSINNYLLFCGGLLLVLVWAAGVKLHVFRLPLARWAIFSASLVSVLMVLVGNALQFVPG